MRPNRQSGIVSLAISIIVGILLTIIVVSMIQVMIRVQREATDGDLSTQAYYAAESGVEEALLTLQNKLKTNSLTEMDFANTCTTGAPQANGSLYTCQRVTHLTNQLSGVIERDGQPVQIDLSDIPFDHIVLSWNSQADCNNNSSGGCSGVGTPTYSLPANFPGASGALGINTWHNPAVPELTTVSFPVNRSSIRASDVTLTTSVIKPGSSTSTQAYTTSPVNGDCSNPISATPGGPGSYNCQIELDSFGSGAHIIRLRARYAGMHYLMRFFDSANNPIPVPDQFATIDVTAQSGDVFRRIVYKVRLVSGTANVDYAIYSDTNICKNITSSLAVGVRGCPYP